MPSNKLNNQEERQEQSSQLLRLPLKIREQIYTYLLDARHIRGQRSFVSFPQIQDGKLCIISSSKPFHFSLAILRTNKQIHRESLHIFHTTNLFVHLSIYNDDIYWTQAFLEGSGLGFASSNHSRLSTLTSQTLDVKLIMEDSQHLRCQVVFTVHYLPRFIQFLKTMCDSLSRWSREHSIHLFLRHRYRSGPLATGNIILEPWRALHGLHQVVIGTDIVSPSYALSLRTNMMGSE